MQIGSNKTVFIAFAEPLPRAFKLYNKKGELYFERYLNGNTPRIKFNIVHADDYYSNVPFSVVKITDIVKPEIDIDLPPYERDRIKDFTITDNFSIGDTPARIFTHNGVIERGKKFYTFPKPMRVFFLLHEIGHFFYKTEEYCDLFALVHFVRMGYNPSTAVLCMTRGLKRSKQNVERVKNLFNQLKK